MVARQLVNIQPQNLMKAAEGFYKLDLLLPDFQLESDRETEWEWYLNGLTQHQLGRGLSEIEESYEYSRWLRTQAMLPNLDRFIELCKSAYSLVSEITKCGLQSHLAIRAVLQPATDMDRPSQSIHFKPSFLPSNPPLDISDYEEMEGGPHVFGARLLWRCAGAMNPIEFGLPTKFSNRLWTQPFWFSETDHLTCRVNRRPFDLIRDTVNFMTRIKSRERSPQINGLKDGPAVGGIFNWKGKQIELQPVHFHLMDFLWEEHEKGKSRIPVETIVDRVWRGKHLADNSYWAHLSKLNAMFVSEGIPITLGYRKAHFTIEVNDLN